MKEEDVSHKGTKTQRRRGEEFLDRINRINRISSVSINFRKK
jgi:hypothetical protein